MINDSAISLAHQLALTCLVRQLKPRLSVEIGMANGASTKAILSTIGEGTLISVDPNQWTQWNGEGLKTIDNLASHHRLIELPDYLALPELLASGTKIDFAYIDGWHTFDYVLLDFFYLDKMLENGGVIGFNDCSMPSIDKVLKFVTRHRKYVEIPVLKPTYTARNLVYRLGRRILNRQTQDRYFKKLQNWEPDWRFFQSF